MLFRNVTPPLPNTDYIPAMITSLKRHFQAIKLVQAEFDFYFKHSIPRQQKIAPKEFEQAYIQLDSFGKEFVRCFDEFTAGIEPILKTSIDLLKMKENVSKSLEKYQKQILVVRKEMTEANIKIEGERLQEFANTFAEFNKQSNLLKTCLLQLYKSSCMQFEHGMSIGLSHLNQAIESPLLIQKTEEEFELDEYIKELNQEIVEKQQKEKQEREKQQKEKQEREKQQKEQQEKQPNEDKPKQNEQEKQQNEDEPKQNEESNIEICQQKSATTEETEKLENEQQENIPDDNSQNQPDIVEQPTTNENEITTDHQEADSSNN